MSELEYDRVRDEMQLKIDILEEALELARAQRDEFSDRLDALTEAGVIE